MAFITDNKEDIKTKIRNPNDFYIDAENKGISIAPFDIYKYVDTFENIEVINDNLNYPYIGIIQKEKDEGMTGYVIAINKYLPIEYQRVILARLFSHYVLHSDHFNHNIKIKNFWTNDEMSKEANILTSELLIPKPTLLEFIKGGSSVGKIAEYFKVSVNMAKFRASNLALIDDF